MKKLLCAVSAAVLGLCAVCAPSAPAFAQKKTAKKTTKKTSSKSSSKSSSKKQTKSQSKKRSSRKSSDRKNVSEKEAASREQKQISKKLTNLKKEIKKTEVQQGKVANELAESRKAINATEKSLADLKQKRQESEAELSTLTGEANVLEKRIAAQRAKIAKIVRLQHTTGSKDEMKVMLSGKNPNEINRQMRYLGYFSQKHKALYDDLNKNLAAVQTKHTQANAVKNKISSNVKKTEQEKRTLEGQKRHHEQLLSRLSDKLEDQKRRAQKLEEDQKRLASVIERLNKQSTPEPKQQKKTASKQTKKTKKGKTVREKAPEYSGDTNSAFAKSKGSLAKPVAARITRPYGHKIQDGPAQKGVFYQCASGTAVKAISAGRVVFSDSLRGFGKLLIVDHGSQYMSVYANLGSVSKSRGSSVSKGETIGSAGSSGDFQDSGLYFEMRHKGRPLNPQKWVN